MVQPISKNIKNQNPFPFNIQGDFELFQKIVFDMKNNSGDLAPSENWGLDIGGHHGGEYFAGKEIQKFSNIEELYNARYSTMLQMMDPWIGCNGMSHITAESLMEYSPFLRSIDFLSIVDNYFNTDCSLKNQENKLLITDLGSIIDINLIHLFSNNLSQIKILEVGGGYGRLAEAAFNIYGNKNVKMVLTDSVPASLLYAYKYLSKHFPNLKIGFYYNNDNFDLEEFDCYIIPSWHFENLNSYTFDICCNIQSMQEMNQYHVDYYLNLFDKIINKTGIIYLSNEHDYVFKGHWNYPARWNKLLKIRTPRSWTRNSPTEIFRIEKNFEEASVIADVLFENQLQYFDKLTEYSNKINNLETTLQTLQNEIHAKTERRNPLKFISNFINNKFKSKNILKTEPN